MNKLCRLLEIENEDLLFEKITSSFKQKITQWDYFVNWKKVYENIKPVEKELNLLNYLIGKEDIKSEAFQLIKEYPEITKTFPILIAIREQSIDILIDTKNFIYRNYSFGTQNFSDEQCMELVDFMLKSGIGEILRDKKVKNIVDYALGVEVGLDSNGRKNRVGILMESLVEDFVLETCNKMGATYLRQANAKKIKMHWGIDIKVDKSSRNLDFAIKHNEKIIFIECNFYGGGGSKLKSTSTEYIEMNRYWNNQNIQFVWITDGAGWRSTLKPLREFFDKADYLLNLELLKDGALEKIITC